MVKMPLSFQIIFIIVQMKDTNYYCESPDVSSFLLKQSHRYGLEKIIKKQ